MARPAPLSPSLREAERMLRETERKIDGEIKEIATEAKAQVAVKEREKAALAKARAQFQMDGTKRRRRRKRRSRTATMTPEQELDSWVKQAGKANIERVAEYLRGRGRAYQSAITKDTGIASGNVSHSLKVLTSTHRDGGPVVRATGNSFKRSREFEWLGSGQPVEEKPTETPEPAPEKEPVPA